LRTNFESQNDLHLRTEGVVAWVREMVLTSFSLMLGDFCYRSF